MQKTWRVADTDAHRRDELLRQLKIHPVLCSLLVQRGVYTFDDARDFFRPQLSGLHDPFLMKDMEAAVVRILAAFAGGEKILVFGDYDVDGTTAVACMYRFLKQHHAEVDFYIPHRYREGYGVSRAGIEYAHETGCRLIISLDCGIKSADLIAYASSLGIDFIVCDHHLPDAQLPAAVAVLNPKRTDCPYPYKELCGCGVGFKLIQALGMRLRLPADSAHKFLDLVATAIAADIVPITGENRILAYYGLKKANANPNPGIKALAKLSAFTQEIKINNLVFIIAPRVNAAGRMDEGRKAVMMFIAETEEEARHWAEQLHTDNTQRKEADSSITEEALDMLRKESGTRRSTVVYQPHWHKGVVGIVASRLIEHYYRPTIVLTQSGDYVAGSARSIHGFNIYEALHQCKDLLIGYGGHFHAAGMTLHAEQVASFSDRFEEVVQRSLTPEQLIPELHIDAEITLADIRKPFYNILCQMEPFGPENLCPTFLARGVMPTRWCKVLKDAHLKIVVQQGGITATGIGFNMAEKMAVLQQHTPVDVVFRIDANEWNGETSLQMKVIDIRPAS